MSDHHDPALREPLAHALVDYFVRIGPISYDDIRQILTTVKSAGLTTLR